jgi:hypothetical protein
MSPKKPRTAVTQMLLGNTSVKDRLEELGVAEFRQPSPVKESPLDKYNSGQVSATHHELKRRGIINFDEEEELVSSLREYIR